MRLAGKKINDIAVEVNRHRNTISNYLKNVENYGCSKRSGRISALDERTKRRVRHLAAVENMSCRQIKVKLDLAMSRQRIHQVIKDDIKHSYENKIPKPPLTQKHKNARIKFVEKYKFWDDEFNNVIFSDEKSLT